MTYDVVVVGGGIGGLTVAALLAARGVSTCLLERQSQVGGCLGRVEFSGHDFEPGMGLYTSFGPDEIHAKIFSELPVPIPDTSLVTTEYVVRLADGTDVMMYSDHRFDDELRRVFPESATAAVEFYRRIGETKHARRQTPLTKLRSIWKGSADVSASGKLLDYLTGTSPRFHEFVDAQLSALLHLNSESCSIESAAKALTWPRGNRYLIDGGPATLAERLAESIKQSGGVVRLNSPVLRLAYDQSGKAIGVDLLSGETVIANRAIVSNMTVWDTYGKLVGLHRIPPEAKKMLLSMQGTGAYLIYASLEESAVRRLPSNSFVVCASDKDIDGQSIEFTFATSSGIELEGKRTVTLKMRTGVEEWFSFQSSEEDYEKWDQNALERFWTILHRSVPELGNAIEVIETATPRTFYDLTRRKLGMVMGLVPPAEASFRTTIPNVFMVGDTVTKGASLAGVSESALLLANQLVSH
jgi:phytoene dehydrogenase-like protein